MDLQSYSVFDLIDLYSELIAELRKRGVLRTNNLVSELGEYIVIENYLINPDLPTLNSLPVGTQNVNAMSQTGHRYVIKSVSSTTTSAFYGLEPPGSNRDDTQLFEYLVICKFGENFSVEGIYEIDWKLFLKYKKWNSRMKAWNIQLTNALKKEAKLVYPDDDRRVEKVKNQPGSLQGGSVEKTKSGDLCIEWNMSKGLNHTHIRKSVAKKVGRFIGARFNEDSTARYIDDKREIALFVTSASYSAKNKEYWYSINDELLPWMETFPAAYVAFAMGGDSNVLLFDYDSIKQLLPGCLRTEEDEIKGKIAHYHISFDVERSNSVLFKKKKPEKGYVDVSKYLIKE